MPGIRVIPLRASLVLLAVAVLVLCTSAELAYQTLVGIPGEVTAEQSATARRILARQSGPVREALAAGRPGLAESSLLRESANPDLSALVLVDPAGNVAAATRGDWRGRPAGSLVPGLGLLGDSSQIRQGDVRIGLDRPRRSLTAALPVADSTVAAGSLRGA
ncbi:MAG: hypothetical protein WAM94_11530, partial [Chromatiaceae bacterium]